MPKKGTETTNIYELQIKSINTEIIKIFGGLAMLFLVLDFLVSTLYHNYTIWIFGIFFKLLVLGTYLYIAPTAYLHYKHSYKLIALIMLPTIALIIYIYIDLFGYLWSLVILFLFAILLRLFYLDVKKIEIDYEKSSKNLLKIYPEPLELFNTSHHYVVKKKKPKPKPNNIFLSITSNIPIWTIFAFPIISAEIAVAYLSKNGVMAGVMGMNLLLCIGYLYIGFVSYKNIHIFHEAQKILDKQK